MQTPSTALHLSRGMFSLSAAELARVEHCQQIAQSLGLVVVSSGVFAAEAGELAGLHFWLVVCPSAPASAPVLVWLSAERRLLCGCKRRRFDGALTCCHAQCVRLWLLAAAGGPVPPVPPSSPASAPVPVGSPVEASASAPAPVRACVQCGSARIVTTSPARPGPHGWAERCKDCGHVRDISAEAEAEAEAEFAAHQPSEPAESMGQCPACEQSASAGVLRDWGVCAECLDLMAEAERQPRPPRCQTCGELATGESGNGVFCSACQQRMRAANGPDRYELMSVSHP